MAFRSQLSRALVAATLLWAGAASAQDAPGSAPGDGGAPSDGDAPAAEQPAPAPAPVNEPRVIDQRGAPVIQALTPEEQEALDEFEQDFQTYANAALAHQQRIYEVLYREYLDAQAQLDKRYADSIKNTEAENRQLALDAIARLEAFIRKYPDHPKYTPDAMFRLADLYLDESNYEYEKQFQLAAAGFEDATAADPADGTDGGDGAETDLLAEGPNFSRSVALWRQIVDRFPEYRQMDGTLYLLGYYLAQSGKDAEALNAYLALVCANKYKATDPARPPLTRDEIRARLENKAPFTGYDDCEARTDVEPLIQEAWVRGIGDAHFNAPGFLPEAIAAYKKVGRNKESTFYDEALYKLAWSYYRNDNFIEAIEAFDESVVYSDKVVAEGGDALDLRNEAITYIAISFTDPWSVEESTDPVRAWDRATAFYKGRESESHVRDVFEQLGDTFRIIEAYEQAIDSWRFAITTFPLDPRNPVTHQKIVSAFEAMGDKDLADDEAAKLATLYSKGSEWYSANETNREAIENQARIGQRALRASAENTHRAAQIARKDWQADQTAEGKERYVTLYTKAAELYRQYLDTYPDNSDVYEFTYRIADSQFFSEQYNESIENYRWVRDHRDLGEKYYLPAALSIVQAHRAQLDLKLASGEIVEPPVPTADALKAMGTVSPQNIPQEYQDLRAAYDEYQRLVADPKTAPIMALAAALVSYRFLHLDDAVGRFEVVLDRFCGSGEAVEAKDGLLVIYETRGEREKFTETNNRFIDSACGDTESIALAKAQNRSMEFSRAEEKFNGQNYDDAAIEFYRFYKTAPDDDPNRPIALYNSAIAYDRSGRPKTAIFLFEEFTTNKDDEFRKSPYYVEALYLTAVSQQKAFDYQAAVDTYLDVVKVASEKDRPQPPGARSLEQIRLDALFNAALLRELDRVYKDPRNQRNTGAISLYRRYNQLETDRRKKDRAVWAIARVYESMRDVRSMEKAYADWRKTYGRDPGNEQDYVFTFYNTAKKWEEKGVSKSADKARRETIKAWETVGKPTGTPTAEMAAEMEFHYAEAFFQNRFEKFTFRWPKKSTQKNVEKALDEYDQLTAKAQEGFLALAKYESPIYGAAALVRIGDIQLNSAQRLITAPVPKEIERLDEKYPSRGILDTFLSRIEELVQPKQDQAALQWKKVVQTARAAGVSNEWTDLALERLHDFVSPDEFPVLRPPLIGTTEKL